MTPIYKCIHCHKCRENCAFLSKYGVDICDINKLKELAFHCFLCGRCTAVCPVGIDGRAMIMDMRRERSASAERPELEDTFKGVLTEKRDYSSVSMGSVQYMSAAESP